MTIIIEELARLRRTCADAGWFHLPSSFVQQLFEYIDSLSAQQGKGWEPIHTLPDRNDLVWLGRRRSGFEVKGPLDPYEQDGGFVVHDGWDYWAPCEAPPPVPAPPTQGETT